MQKSYKVPIQLIFNSEADIMNNLTVHDLTVQDKIVSSDHKVRYLFENEIYIDLEYLNEIEPFPEKDKEEILLNNPNATFVDSNFVSTVITSNKPFKVVEEINNQENEHCVIETTKVYLSFEQ